jgi:predicted acylesterase/phospholipase RssA
VDLASDPLVEEVRVAMALNGGVSLAIWMGGCAVELDAARRAHLAEPRPVYAALCRAFARVLVVDVMSGASAGGINGAMLAAAIVHRRRLRPDFVRGNWLRLGDFTRLLQRTSSRDPRALMQGVQFATDLEDTFKALVYDEPCEIPDPAEPLEQGDAKLDVTTTDLAGRPVKFVDFWNQPLEAREYRARFRFRSPEQFSPERLAHASRASASFPLAFEPYHVSAEDATLAGLGGRWVIDGGVLDNAPIAAAIDLIPGRSAWRQVRRFVCYVDADPPTPVEPEPGEPMMAAIAGHVITLPRKAPFVDQLHAVAAATRGSLLADHGPEMALLALDLDSLTNTARGLLPAYRTRRTLDSLDELLGHPGNATELVRKCPDLQLPWIPQSLDAAGPDGRWQWGVMPAQRAAHLLLDALRRAVPHRGPDERKALLDAGSAVYAQVAELETKRAAVSDNALAEAITDVQKFDPRPQLRAAVAETLKVKHLLHDADARALFAPAPDELDGFLRRALALEVVRRAGHNARDIESGQQLRFVQLTPHAPGLLFQRAPWTPRTWTPRDKLLGIRLGHFGGFYRGSWRANDFMWGRMDAAARIVDMLVAPGRIKQVKDEGWAEPAWTVLADALAEGATELQAQLLEEALAGMPAGYPRAGGDLRARLEAALEYDLDAAPEPRGRLTRIVCTRAAQLEVFRDELPPLAAASERDASLGAGTKALRFASADAALTALREGPPLLTRLAAPDEVTSTLALRTSAHAGLVALGALRAARLPLSRSFFGLRALLLPIAGTVANAWPLRAGVWLAFSSAALLIAARIVQIDADDTEIPLSGSWASYLVLTAIALLVVAGTAFVPALRVLRGRDPARRALEAVKALGLAATGVAGAALVAWWLGDVSWAQLIAAPGVDPPPDAVMAIVIAVVVGTPLALVPAIIGGWLDALIAQPWAGWPMLVIFAIVAVLVSGFSLPPLWDELFHGEAWQQVAAAFALPGAPVVAALCLRLWRRGVAPMS